MYDEEMNLEKPIWGTGKRWRGSTQSEVEVREKEREIKERVRLKEKNGDRGR